MVRTAWLYGAHGSCFPRTIARLARERGASERRRRPGRPAHLDRRRRGAGLPPRRGRRTGRHLARDLGRGDLVVRVRPAGGRGSRAVAGDRQPTTTPTQSTAGADARAARPAYSVLGHEKLHAHGIEPIGPWEERWQAGRLSGTRRRAARVGTPRSRTSAAARRAGAARRRSGTPGARRPPPGDPTLSPCRCSIVRTKLPASYSESKVPVSSQVDAALEHLDREAALLEVVPADVGDLVLPARRGLQAAGDLDDVVVVEVQTGNGELAPRVLRLLLEGHRLPVGVELHHAVRTGVRDAVGEDGGTVDRGEASELPAEAVAVEEVVAEDQRAGSSPMKSAPIVKAWARPFGSGCWA